MISNPLFPDNNPVKPAAADDAAVQLIRSKVARVYGEEPAAVDEIAKVNKEHSLSKHQLFMQNLSQSGVSLAEIQTQWHHYYTQLPDSEKHEVWQEFYAANQNTPYQKLFQKQQYSEDKASTALASSSTSSQEARVTGPIVTTVPSSENKVIISDYSPKKTVKTKVKKPKAHHVEKLVRKSKIGRQIVDSPTADATRRIKQRIQKKVSANGKLQAKHHLQSLLFGLGMGGIVLLVLLFSFFNEYIIAPFIQPSKHVTSAPVIAANLTAAQAAKPSVIVSSINIQIPVDFELQSIDEGTIQNSLENGVIHYPSTVLPGQNGNSAFFGHSSSNIFNNGKYKFAFVLLHQVKIGEVFSIVYGGKAYSYEVFAKEIVPPSQTSVLNDTKGEQATAVLITCDPPGLSTNRLVVWGKQISPSPVTNSAAIPRVETKPQVLSNNGPTLWSRLVRGVQFWR